MLAKVVSFIKAIFLIPRLIEQKKIIQALDKNRKINKSNRPSHCIQKTDITEDNEIAQNKTSIFQTG